MIKQTAIYSLLLITLPLILVQSALAQESDLQNYVLTHYGMDEGLPQSSVNDIIQTQDGYIWLATYGGLVRFDGVSFTTFDRSNTKGMRSDRILSLYEDSSGAIWISTEDGFIRYYKGEFVTYLIYVDSQIFAPSAITEDGYGVLWLTVHGKPFKFKNDEFVNVPVVKNPAASEKAVKDLNAIWLAHGKQIQRTMGDSVALIADLSSELDSNIKDFVEYPKNSGTYYIGTDGGGVVRYENGDLTFFSTQQGLPSRYIWKFDIDRSNNLWVSGYNGQSVWNGKKFIPFSAITATEDIQFSNVLEDTEGNYWIGTKEKGVFKLRPSIISMIGYEQGLLNEKMLSLTKLRDGRTLFATNCGGVYEWKNNQAEPLMLNSYLPNQCVWSVFQDSKNRIWFGTKELYRTNSLEEPGESIDAMDGFTGYDIFAITEDSQGNIWIGCFNGVFVYDGETFQRYTTEDGLYYNDTRVFFEDSDGTMWIGSSSGLSTVKDGVIKKVNLLEGIENSEQLPPPYVRAIHKDEDGVMWIGSYGNGIFRLKDETIINITKDNGLFDNIVSHIVEDENGYFWMGSNRGISRVSRKELNDFIAGKTEQVRSYSYGTADGMNAAETNGGFQPSVISDSLANIYFPTVAGVAVVSTREVKRNEVPPPVYIENLRTNEAQIPLSPSITLPYDNPFLEIKYTAVSFSQPKKVQFKYKMEGFDDSWIDVGNRRLALYTKIPPGEYIFRVIASNNDGVWNTTGASFRIMVVPPFWRTLWFYGLIIFLLLAIGTLGYYYRIQQLKKENEKQKRFTELLINSQENERRRIASELHDGLGQQILVIKNRAELAQQQVNDPAEIREQLREIMQSAVSSIGDVRNISHGLRPVHLEKFGLTEALTNLCDQLQDISSIEWSYHIDKIDGYIPREKEINFYRVIQEGTNNILKHAEAKEAFVMVLSTPNGIKAKLWDDGKGFNAKIKQSLGGLGFSGMNERIEALRGTLDIQSTEGEGTLIKIYIPVSQNYG